MNNNNTYTYCERLKELRTGKGWSLQQAAIKFDVTKSKFNSYETVPETYSNGMKSAGREAPIDFLLKACKIYGVTLDYLCGRAEVPAPTLELAEISEITGLSVEAVKNLNYLNISKDITATKPNYEGDFKSYNPDSKPFLNVFNLLAEFKCNGGWSQHIIRNIAFYLFYCDRSQTYEITKYEEERYDYLVGGETIERIHLDALYDGLKELKNKLLRSEEENGKHN